MCNMGWVALCPDHRPLPQHAAEENRGFGQKVPEDVGRTQRVDRGERPCPHCGAQLQSASHAFFECPFFEEWREEQEGLFTPGMSLAD